MQHKHVLSIVALAVVSSFSLSALAASPVNVNTADADTIAASLDGVGQVKAEAIVAYREAHGSFDSAQAVGKVKGIGEATLEDNREAIRMQGHPSTAAVGAAGDQNKADNT